MREEGLETLPRTVNNSAFRREVDKECRRQMLEPNHPMYPSTPKTDTQTPAEKETPMNTDTLKSVQTRTEVFDVIVDDKSPATLMEMIRKAKADKATLADLQDESKYVQGRVANIDKGIAALVKQLDKKA
jgi:hypothetical protein